MSSNKKVPMSKGVNFRNVESLQKYGYFGMIFGRPGVGKTSLLAHRERNFFIGNELNKEFKMSGFEHCETWSQFLDQLATVLTSIDSFEKKFDTLIIDNFSDLEGLMIEEFTKGENLSTWNKGYGAGFVECERRIRELIKVYIKPLQEKGINIIFICHCDEKQADDLITGGSQTEYIPSLSKKTLKPLEAHASFIFHLHIPITPGKKAFQRVLLTSPTVASKSTKKKINIDLPDRIEIKDKNPEETWGAISEKLSPKGEEDAKSKDKISK